MTRRESTIALRDAGFRDGDRLVVKNVQPMTVDSWSTTSGTYVTDSAHKGRAVVSLSEIPEDATIEGRMNFQTAGTQDAAGDYRLLIQPNDTDDITSPSVTVSSTFSEAETDWVEIPSRAPTVLKHQLRSDGTNGITIANPSFEIAVVL